MGFLTVGLMAAAAAGCFVLARELLQMKRELTVAFRAIKGTGEQMKELVEAMRETTGRTEAFISSEAETVQSLSRLWRESERQTEALRALLAREDAAEAVGRMERAMKEASPLFSADEEARMSREMQQGVENLLCYSVGAAREAKT